MLKEILVFILFFFVLYIHSPSFSLTEEDSSTDEYQENIYEFNANLVVSQQKVLSVNSHVKNEIIGALVGKLTQTPRFPIPYPDFREYPIFIDMNHMTYILVKNTNQTHFNAEIEIQYIGDYKYYLLRATKKIELYEPIVLQNTVKLFKKIDKNIYQNAYYKNLITSHDHSQDRFYKQSQNSPEIFQKYLNYLKNISEDEKMINYLYKKNISYPKSLDLCRKNEFPIDPFIEKDIELKYIDSKLQFGVFAKKPIKKGTLLGEYTGLIGQGFMQNIYAWNYPSKLPTTTYIDASLFGNILRYINDIDFPNLHPLFIYYKHNWKLVLLANTDIAPGDQLSVRYGDQYWKTRQKVTYS